MVERQYPEMIAAVSLLHDGRLYAAAGAPEAVGSAWRSAHRSTSGSCGASAYWGNRRGRRYRHRSAWDEHRELALSHHLAACWSTPILDGNGKALGAFAVYRRKAGRPDKEQAALLQTTSGTAAIAIEQRQLADQLDYQAHHDALTGLPNRLLFQERLRHEIAQSRRSGTMLALLLRRSGPIQAHQRYARPCQWERASAAGGVETEILSAGS